MIKKKYCRNKKRAEETGALAKNPSSNAVLHLKPFAFIVIVIAALTSMCSLFRSHGRCASILLIS